MIRRLTLIVAKIAVIRFHSHRQRMLLPLPAVVGCTCPPSHIHSKD
jgi:hypothetical protein